MYNICKGFIIVMSFLMAYGRPMLNTDINLSLIQSHLQHKRVEYGARCTPSQLKNIEIANPIESSNCPSRGFWFASMLKYSSVRPTATIVSVGCNTGDDFVAQVGAFSGNSTYNSKEWVNHLSKDGLTSGPACGRNDVIPTPVKLPRPITAYCIEPMSANIKLVQKIHKTMAFDSQSIFVMQLAMNVFPGMADFPKGRPGQENLGLADGLGNSEIVNVSNLDTFIFEHQLNYIDFLSIDTEGFDGYVIIGMVNTLARHKVRVFEFEYHIHGPWKTMDLSLIVDLLDVLEYDCFWQGNSNQLWRLTGCWSVEYGLKRTWSNIVCVHRQQYGLHKDMVGHSQLYM